mmetsp:Transcript_19412/g.29186  ORF Transcript_19412/g.29186 Transcript_19412/m.29186 type:complete len:235 (+) Transcript_19412:41-745(+)
METIVCLNNQGVMFFQLGRLEEASAYFRNAALELNAVKKRSGGLSTLAVHDHSRDFNPITGWSCPFTFNTTLEGSSVMFTRALILKNPEPQNLPNEENPSPRYQDAVALALLYNSAILNHVYSDSNGQISKSTNAAYHAYEQTFAISQRFEKTDNAMFSFHLKVLRLVLLNNMGVLYHNSMCRFRDASRCFNSARHLIEILGKNLIAAEIMTLVEVQQLSLNVVVVPIAAAPVA